MDKTSKAFKSPISRTVQVWVNLPSEKNRGLQFSISKRYKDKTTGDWVASKVFFPEDIAALIDVLPRAMNWATENMTTGRADSATEINIDEDNSLGDAALVDDDIPFGDMNV